MLENTLTDIQQDARHGIRAEISRDDAHRETQNIDGDHDCRQQEKERPVARRQHAVNHDFQHHRHGQCQTGKHYGGQS